MNSYFANALKNETVKSTQNTASKTTSVVRMSGPYAMFGPGRTVQTVPNTTSFNGRTSLYKITTSKMSYFGGSRYGMNATVPKMTTPVVRTTPKMSYFGMGRYHYDDTAILILNAQ